MLFQASSDLNKDHQVGVFLGKKLNNDSTVNFGFGVKKVFESKNFIKAKMDSELNAAVYYDHKIRNGYSVQGTVATNFSDSSNLNGFLGSGYMVGLKVKYDC